jgi:hypothetical protein
MVLPWRCLDVCYVYDNQRQLLKFLASQDERASFYARDYLCSCGRLGLRSLPLVHSALPPVAASEPSRDSACQFPLQCNPNKSVYIRAVALLSSWHEFYYCRWLQREKSSEALAVGSHQRPLAACSGLMGAGMISIRPLEVGQASKSKKERTRIAKADTSYQRVCRVADRR